VAGYHSFAASKKIRQEVDAYQRLHSLLRFFSRIPVLDYDEAAADRLSALKRLRLRIGTMDLKIAAIALSKNAILLTSNTVDFEGVPGLTIEDWTK
jgi:tRNA(fMet)-specific endonuclease VapC